MQVIHSVAPVPLQVAQVVLQVIHSSVTIFDFPAGKVRQSVEVVPSQY